MLHEEIEVLRGKLMMEFNGTPLLPATDALCDLAELVDEWYDHKIYPARYPNTVDKTRVRTSLEKLKKVLSGHA